MVSLLISSSHVFAVAVDVVACGSNTLQFFLRGLMPLDYSLAFLSISLVAGWVSRPLVLHSDHVIHHEGVF